MLEPENHKLLEVWEADDSQIVLYYPPWRRVMIFTIASRQTFIIPEELMKKKPGPKTRSRKPKTKDPEQQTLPTYPTEEAIPDQQWSQRFEPAPGVGLQGFARGVDVE